MDQSIFKLRTEGTGTSGEGPSETSAELERAYRTVVNAITATVLNAQSGLNWLSAQPSNLEEVRQSLNSIANDGKRAGEFIVQLRTLAKKVPTVNGTP